MRQVVKALAWLSDNAAQVWAQTVEHAWYSLLAVAAAALVAIPAGWWVGHRRRGRGAAVGLSGAARALPTLGVVTLAGIAFGIGPVGPVIALAILAAPSILAGAYAGFEAVDAAVLDAARANGMSERQILTQVEIPLGLGLLVGGLRSATLQVIATATLAAYVGAGGLGRPLFLGLKTQDYPQMLGAALAVVALAVAADLVFAMVQRLIPAERIPT